MERKERVKAAVKGEWVDHVPCGFSLHFPKTADSFDKTVKAHLDFFEATDTDIAKIMNENLVTSEDLICTSDDFDKIPEITMDTPYMAEQVRLVREIVKESGKGRFFLGTLHGICASSVHPLEQRGVEYMEARKRVLQCLRTNPDPVLRAFERITKGMCQLAKAYIEEGMDGVYYAALGGERDLLTDEEFEKWFMPYDLEIMDAIRGSGGYCFLHICKDHLNMERYRSYASHADAVNWGVYEAPFSLEEGRRMFPDCAIMGGLPNRSGVMTDGSVEELEKETERVIRSFGKTGFILGADCTLPTEISYERIRRIVEQARKI